MNPIRPNFPLVTTPRPVRPEARAAQRAFFEAALTRGGAVKTSSAEPIRAATASARSAPAFEEQPQRYVRPGSLVDIKV